MTTAATTTSRSTARSSTSSCRRSGVVGAAPVGRRRPVRHASSRPRAPWCSAPTRTTRSDSRSTARSRRPTTRSSSCRCRWRRRTPRPGAARGRHRGVLRALQHSPPPPALAGLTITDDLPWNFSAGTPGAGAGQRQPQGREGDRLGVGLQRQPVQQGLRDGGRLHQQAQGLRHRPPAGREPDRIRPTRSTDGVDVPAELATLDARLAVAGLPANHPLRAADPAAPRRLWRGAGRHPDPGRQRARHAA